MLLIINDEDLSEQDVACLRQVRGVALRKPPAGIRPVGLGSKIAQLCEGAVYREAAPTITAQLWRWRARKPGTRCLAL